MTASHRVRPNSGPSPKPEVRVAIYTRKSNEAGLDQAFNSLDAQRQAALQRGADFPEMSERALSVMRYVIPIGAVVTTFVMSVIFAGLYTLVFAFVLGDEGRFKQYLAVLAHSSFIAAVFTLLATPLRISTGDPQFTLNVGSFFIFLPDGYLLNVLRSLDLTQIWSTLVVAQGVHAIDRRRSFGSAATILLTILLAFVLVVALQPYTN